MRILTWNLERLQRNKNQQIIQEILQKNADIAILTETSSLIDLSSTYPYSWQTTELIRDNAFPKDYYKPKENRVTIWSKFPGGKAFDTFNNSTAICREIITPHGIL